MPTATASQTIGPYWHLLEEPDWADLTRFGAEGERHELYGRVTDGSGAPMTDACVEIWQADPPASPTFPAFGRAATDTDGFYRFTTIMPGPVPGLGNAQQAPHLAVTIFARGLLTGVVTRCYFAGEALNETDPVLNLVEDPKRRATLVAQRDPKGAWRFDIRMQGDDETVFMDV